MSTDFTFAYGSNMNYSDLRSWLERNGYESSRIVNRWIATLDGYGFVWNYYSRSRAGGAANLERKDKATVWGILIEFDTPILKAFDRKEGHPYFYSRGNDRVPVTRVEDKQVIPAWLYVASPNMGNRRDVRPTRVYKKIIVDAAIEEGLPEDYVSELKDWPTDD
jgi:gamma-glutamylcyclotransferase (GGCT)/AIG2-like uncharacterized protein YtfP